MAIVETKDLHKMYLSGDGNEVRAVDGINLRVEEGEFIAMVGESGCGKSTLLHLLGGLDDPTFGDVCIQGEAINRLKKEKLAIFRRRHIGFVFQEFNLIPVLNVYENIVYPLLIDHRKIDDAHVQELLTELKIGDRQHHMPAALSGGQRQRVALARALATRPSIVLADEPTGNLDSKTSSQVFHLLRQTAKKYNQTVLMVTHSESLAQKADRIIKLADGKVEGE
ncbi:ABC transporter ATP-binding protein [Paenibacillus sp. J5C_2022]|uniref:ABC transporter ATP-binding protein n=1 Tax=Paenibacillus sp. J5C2022 TaxID=2977129 RepID=UPI0021CEAE06|nr:ABC transporter ATP-binding protein [Paenibacillus sp. J5C2022]MCU6707881.1 ABC transporter ATP-binding protein [Paenibacillus sp. J5C2022]